MRLLAWRTSTRWSQWHLSHIGLPLCGTPMPDKPQAQHERAARPSDWPHLCAKCKELAIRGATASMEPRVIDLMAALKAALKTKPADRGEAVDGLNGLTGAAGPVDLEPTIAGQERVAR